MILLRIFKNNRTSGAVALVILALAVFTRSFILGVEPGGSGVVSGYYGMPFYNLIFGAIHTKPILNHIITLLLVIFLGYTLIRIGVRYLLLDYRSLMPGIFFLFFIMALPSTQQISPALVGSIFYLFCFAILFDAHDKEPNTFSIFTASFILVLGSMFYLKLIWFIPLIWASLFTLRTATWRELLYPVVAYIMLGVFLIAWYWGLMDNMEGLGELIRNNLAFNGALKPYHFSIYIYYGYLLLLVLVASIYMVNRFQTRKTVTQNIYQVLFFMFVAGMLFFVFIERFEPSTLVFIAFPVSYVLSNYFHKKKNHWSEEVALWIVIGLLVYVQIKI